MSMPFTVCFPIANIFLKLVKPISSKKRNISVSKVISRRNIDEKTISLNGE